jgi:hypothetical protein
MRNKVHEVGAYFPSMLKPLFKRHHFLPGIYHSDASI